MMQARVEIWPRCFNRGVQTLIANDRKPYINPSRTKKHDGCDIASRWLSANKMSIQETRRSCDQSEDVIAASDLAGATGTTHPYTQTDYVGRTTQRLFRTVSCSTIAYIVPDDMT